MDQDIDQLEPSTPQLSIRLGSGLIILNLLDVIFILVVIFFPSNVLRIILVIPFLLFFPGFSILAAIFARKGEIGSTIRVVLSIGLSVVIVALTGLIFNYTVWGIRLEPILYSIASLVLLASIFAWLRQRRLIENERLDIQLNLTRLGWAKQIKDRVITIILMFAILGGLCALIYTVAIPKEGETFTEFFILGKQGEAGDYPDKLKVGDEGRVNLVIINHEKMDVSYSIEVVIDGNTTDSLGPVVLVDEQKWESEVGFLARTLGDEQKVEFVLYKNDEAELCNELHLWIDVVE